MLHTCAAWCAAIQAVPALWPETELFGTALAYEDWGAPLSCEDMQQSLLDAADASQALLEQAAELDELTWHVRITGCKEQVRIAAG